MSACPAPARPPVGQRLSSLAGLAVYILILLPIAIAALQALQLGAVTAPASSMLNLILLEIPKPIAAGLTVAVAYVVGRVVAAIVAGLLAAAGFDRLPARLGIAPAPGERPTPSELVGRLALVALVLFATISAAVELLAERHIHVDRSTVHDRVQRFAPLYQEQARAHRHRAGSAWAVDETHITVAGRPCYLYRAVDEHGQVVAVYYSERRDAAAAEAFFRGALRETAVRPRRVTTDRAAAYPPAPRAVLPEADHVAGKAGQQRIERDHQHLKGRIRCMRAFKSAAGAAVFGRAHGCMRNLRDGFYRLGLMPGDPRFPQRPRLVLAWDELTAQLLAA